MSRFIVTTIKVTGVIIAMLALMAIPTSAEDNQEYAVWAGQFRPILLNRDGRYVPSEEARFYAASNDGSRMTTVVYSNSRPPVFISEPTPPLGPQLGVPLYHTSSGVPYEVVVQSDWMQVTAKFESSICTGFYTSVSRWRGGQLISIAASNFNGGLFIDGQPIHPILGKVYNTSSGYVEVRTGASPSSPLCGSLEWDVVSIN